MYRGLEGFLRIVTSLLEKLSRPICRLPAIARIRPGYSPPLPISHLFPVVTPFCANFVAAVKLALPSVYSLSLL